MLFSVVVTRSIVVVEVDLAAGCEAEAEFGKTAAVGTCEGGGVWGVNASGGVPEDAVEGVLVGAVGQGEVEVFAEFGQVAFAWSE